VVPGFADCGVVTRIVRSRRLSRTPQGGSIGRALLWSFGRVWLGRDFDFLSERITFWPVTVMVSTRTTSSPTKRTKSTSWGGSP